MSNAAQQLARRGRTVVTTVLGTGFRLARDGAELVLHRVFRGDEDTGRPGERPAPSRTAPGAAPTGDPGRVPPPPPRPAAAPEPPSAEEAVAAELSEPPAWEEAGSAPSPPEAALEHVEEEATLVGESADVGAEEGAGPEVTVREPWPGYDRMRARDVVDRLAGADADLASAARLYEASTKRRKTVLEAAERAARA